MKPSSGIEFSRPLGVDKIPAGGIVETMRATPAEREKLAERFGLIDLPNLEAKLEVHPARGGAMYEVTGRMEADVVQQCVVTLEPLPAHVARDIEVLFLTSSLEGAGAPTLGDLDEEETETITGGVIDLGELVAQHLGVALDPYPRKPGTAFVEAQYGDSNEAAPNPFAKLAVLTKKGKDKQ